MLARFRHRNARTARLLALWFLLLAVIWQPVLASVGDLHEVAHGSDVHALDSHAGDGDAGDRDDGGKPDDADSLLHAVMCASHCCGHAVAMPVAWYASTLSAPMREIPALTHVAPRDGLQTHPFRPPIAR